jgi:hypothetical protein
MSTTFGPFRSRGAARIPTPRPPATPARIASVAPAPEGAWLEHIERVAREIAPEVRA